jgi:predicted secreted Zn-dependent protease
MDQNPNPAWRKSSASLQGNCVEVAAADDLVLVRDTKNRHGSVLSFSHSEWSAFLTGVEKGEFTLPNLCGES